MGVTQIKMRFRTALFTLVVAMPSFSLNATTLFAPDPPDARASCLGHFTPDCAKPFLCTNYSCDIPSEATINGSPSYGIADIGLPFGGNEFGVLRIRPMDMGCPASARWDESHSLPYLNCRLPINATEYPYATRLSLNLDIPIDTVECYDRKSCVGDRCEPAEVSPTVRTMVKNGETKKYLVYNFVCNSGGSIEKDRIDSEPFAQCDTTTTCPIPGGSSGGGRP